MLRKLIHPLTITLLSLWLGWTVLVDFVVVPTIFREMNDFFGSGNIGIKLFSKLNNFELIVGSLLLALSSWLQVQQKKVNIFLTISVTVLFVIALLYFSYLTPKITTLTALWQKADAMGVMGLEGIADLQQEHQFYHRLYISIDTAKLILLAAVLTYAFKNQKELT